MTVPSVVWFLLVTLISASPLSFKHLKHDTYVSSTLCTSVECLEAAYKIKSSLNMSADPCENFYQFACGGYVANTRIPSDKSKIGEMRGIADELHADTEAILESSAGDDDWELDEMVRQHYRDCMDQERRDELGNQPVVEIFQAIGGWPVTGGDNPNEWHQIQKSLSDHGFGMRSTILSVSVAVDKKDNTKRIVYIDQPSFGLSREFLVDEKDNPEREAYLKYMVDTAVYFGADQGDAEKDMSEVFNFEKQLAQASAPREARRDAEKLYNLAFLDQLQRLEGHPTEWKGYLQGLFGVQLEEKEKIVLKNPEYFEEVANLLAQADKAVLQDYLFFRAASQVMDSLDSRARDVKLEFKKVTRGVKQEEPISKRCAKAVGFQTYQDGLRHIANSMYVRNKFSEEARNQVLGIVTRVRQSFRNILNDLDWMDDGTKATAHKKLDMMLESVAYPEQLLDKDIMEKLHEGMEMGEGNFLSSKLRMNKFWTKKKFARLRLEVDRADWMDNSVLNVVAVVNAFYSGDTNSLVLPAGFMGGLFFNPKAPQFMNHAGIGVVAGHEVSHGFDDRGRQQDETGLLRNWWSQSTLDKFHQEAQCVIDQYSNFKVEQVGLHLNGINSQGENIADIVGNKLAYMAYELWLEEHGHEPGLPGLPFSPRQMFWISRGRATCSKSTYSFMRRQVITGYHSPDEFRVNGPIMNLEQFARDFGCPLGSKMNPETKCKVW